jgi:hypothetical protein
MTTLGIIILLVAGFAYYMYSRSGAKKALKGSPERKALPAERTVRTLRLNDIFSHMGDDYIVVGKLTYEEDGDVWWEHMLEDGDKLRFLSVEDDDRLEVAIWEEIPLAISGSAPPETLEWEGEHYRSVERGEATVRRDGRTGVKEGMRCRYWEYEGPGDKRIAVEKWVGEWEVCLGTKVTDGSYDILPGDLVEG